MERPYPTKSRIRYLLEIMALAFALSIIWQISEVPYLGFYASAIGYSYYTFWIAKQRLMDITSDQEAIQSSFRINIISTPKSSWGTYFWIHYFCIIGNALYLAASVDEGNTEMLESGLLFWLLITAVHIPVHLFLLFKPGYKVEEPLVWYGPDYKHPQIGKPDRIEPQLSNQSHTSSIEDKLRMIKNLHNQELISEDEMVKKRAEILKQIIYTNTDMKSEKNYNSIKKYVITLIVLIIALPLGNIAGDILSDAATKPTYNLIKNNTQTYQKQNTKELNQNLVKDFTCKNFLKGLNINATHKEKVRFAEHLTLLYMAVIEQWNLQKFLQNDLSSVKKVEIPKIEKLEKFSYRVGQICSHEQHKDKKLLSLLNINDT